MANNFFLIALVNFFSAIFLLYLLFRLFQLSFINPIVSNSFKYLEPFLKPFRFVLPILFGIDLSALALVILAKFGLFNLIFSADQIFDTIDALSWAAIGSLYMASQIIRYSLFISIFASWLAPMSNNSFLNICHGLTQPLLLPFQRFTSFSGIDFSPIIVFFLLIQIDRILLTLGANLELPRFI